MRSSLLFVCFTSACSAAPKACNAHAQLCERPFDEVVFAVSHNGMSNEEDGWFFPNQQWPLQRQLDEGVRGFMLDTYLHRDVPMLCHGVCTAGSIDLVQALTTFRVFLEEHPHEVLTFMIEPHLSDELTVAAFEDSGLLAHTHAQPRRTPWPTLGEMIADDRRLVVFHEGSVADIDWYMPGYQQAIWDTDYSAETPEDFSCDILRGDRSHSIFLMNHFLTQPFASEELADQVNVNPLLADRVAECSAEAGQDVDWIAVDFIDRGEVLATVKALNER